MTPTARSSRPAGVPFEDSVPFAVDITNAASGISGLPIEYVPPVVTVGGSPSGTLPDGRSSRPTRPVSRDVLAPRAAVRPLSSARSSSRRASCDRAASSSAVPRPVLSAYRYVAGTNDASDATRSGTYPAAAPIRIQWNTPLPGTRSYPVRLVLDLETTYDDGTVRTSQVSGAVAVTVVYSAVSQ